MILGKRALKYPLLKILRYVHKWLTQPQNYKDQEYDFKTALFLFIENSRYVSKGMPNFLLQTFRQKTENLILQKL